MTISVHLSRTNLALLIIALGCVIDEYIKLAEASNDIDVQEQHYTTANRANELQRSFFRLMYL
jgi:hypothetical protein